MNLEQIKEYDREYFMNTFGERTPVAFEYGKGMKLYSTDGEVYTDFLSGIAVSALGHSHPLLTKAITDQAGKLIHCSSLYYIENQALLAREIVTWSCADKVFFSNSGAEANEGAIKLSRLYHNKQGKPDRYEIITLEKSFHGRTLATIAATGQEKYQKPFCPLTPKFRSVPINDIQALEAAIDENTCAIMLEPIQGESGVNPVSQEYMKSIRSICDEKDVVLIFDEVQCGMGRTGRMFGYEHYGVEPDIFTLAKALGGGFPIGALCAKEKFALAFSPGDHGSTFGGNPLACAAGLAVFEAFRQENLVENSRVMGSYLIGKLKDLAFRFPVITEIRGMGLMIGIQLEKGIAKEIRQAMHRKGFLIGNVRDNILRLLPPLIVGREDIDRLAEAFVHAFTEAGEGERNG
ncbi:MAG: aspartate aminotransferase family protein [Clostridia bacterium]